MADADSPRFRGGSYRAIHHLSHTLGDVVTRLECHHLIPRDCLARVGLNPDLGPSIQMSDVDHAMTASWGGGRAAKRWRARIDALLAQDDLDGAVKLAVDEIRSKFGDRYGTALNEATTWYREWRAMDRAAVALPSLGTQRRAEWHLAPPSRAEPTGPGDGDVTELVRRLTRYLEVLERHNLAIQRAYENAMESLAHLRQVYGGAAADDFMSHWERTSEALERYLQGSQGIKVILEERLSALREADRPWDES